MTHTEHTYTSDQHWSSIGATSGKAYVCPYCASSVASDRGWRVDQNPEVTIRVCPRCNAQHFSIFSTGNGPEQRLAILSGTLLRIRKLAKALGVEPSELVE